MVDFIILLIGFVLTLGLTALAFQTRFRFMVALMAGAMWLCFAYLVIDMSLLLGICCIGMGFYMLVRSAIS